MATLVRDVMTTEVVTAGEAATFVELVELLAGHRIGAVPVIGVAGRVVGIVSESDLLLKQEHLHAEEGDSRFEGRRRRAERRRAAGRTARDLMSSPVATVTPTMPVARAARVMRDRDFKHLPVVDGEGRLVGILSGADLSRVFVRPDADLLREVEDLLAGSRPEVDPARIRARVAGGVVELTGHVHRRGAATLLTYRARMLDGVVGVDARLDFDLDDWSPAHEVDPYRAIPLRL